VEVGVSLRLGQEGIAGGLQCIHRHRFETLQHASRVIGDWIQFYKHQRMAASDPGDEDTR
jgi:hypothetical protein